MYEISIVVPVYNEEKSIVLLIDYLQKVTTVTHEIIVVDGGSKDNTVNLVKNKKVSLVDSSRGRARQMNEGAKIAKGNVIYFLHSDTFPPIGYDKLIVQSVQQGYWSGCFRLRFDFQHPVLKFYQWFSRFNFQVCRGGDRSLFVKKSTFFDIGGYNKLKIMEDYDIVDRLLKVGHFKIIKSHVTTSARKYRKYGLIRLQLVYAYIHYLYWRKMPINELYEVYCKILRIN